MTTEFLSSAPGNGINEDLITVIERDGCIDLVVLDGATSVADADYIDSARGDVAWFTEAFATALERAIAPGMTQAQSVRRAVEAVRETWQGLTAGSEIPLYAHPLAALSWIRIRPQQDHLAVSLYCLGDCKVLALHSDDTVADLDPYVNPQEAVLQAAMAALAAEGVSDPAVKRTRLLPMLRARREEQHRAPAPEVLCLAPQGAFNARESTLHLPPGSALLGMTDGFYRLVDVYGLLTAEELARRCRDEGLEGLEALMRTLRDFEAAASAGAAAFKRADDASAIIWTR